MDTMVSINRAAALEYASEGYAVFPCGKDKQPLTTHGFQDASSDARVVNEMWAAHDGALVGLAVPEGAIVVDVDPRNGGTATLRALKAEHGWKPTKTAQTGGGGYHYWYGVDPALRLRGSLGQGIDVKRAGKGYVIVPPSVTSAGPYRWTRGGMPQPAPEWMLEALQQPAPRERANEDRTPPALFPFQDGTTYGERAMQGELERLADARPGERNDALNRAAYSLGQLIAGGELREEPVRARLADAAAQIGLEPHETELTVASGINAGLVEPRTAPALPDRKDVREPSTRGILGDSGPPEGEDHFWLEWSGEVQPDEYILEPVLPRNAYVLVFGPTEAAKSMVMNALGAQASQRGFSVSVYSLENPPTVDRARLQRLQPAPMPLFRLTNQLLNLADPNQAIALMERERGRDLVILDTYSHAYAQRYDSGDGNAKAVEFARVIRWLMKKTGATFVVIDHTGFENLQEPRDASAKRQQVDVAIGMERTREWERGKPAHARMTNYKSARFANPFRIDVKIIGNGAEPLRLEYTGDTLKWGEPK